MDEISLKSLLERELRARNTSENLAAAPDPLQIAAKFRDPAIALICALFAYGNAKMIVKFLNSLNFEILNSSDEAILAEILGRKLIYRFQNSRDIAEIFITIKRLRNLDIEGILAKNFQKTSKMIEAINALIYEIYALNNYRSFGYEFFFAAPFKNTPKSPYKRYNMWLRWLVRDCDIDLGIFKNLPKSHLILPLDTHTHRVSQILGLCERKSYDFKAALEITQNLAKFDPTDPVKYDFALYRIGQSGEIEKIKGELKGL